MKHSFNDLALLFKRVWINFNLLPGLNKEAKKRTTDSIAEPENVPKKSPKITKIPSHTEAVEEPASSEEVVVNDSQQIGHTITSTNPHLDDISIIINNQTSAVSRGNVILIL